MKNRKFNDLQPQKKKKFIFLKNQNTQKSQIFLNLLKFSGLGILIFLFIIFFSILNNQNNLKNDLTENAKETFDQLQKTGEFASEIDPQEALISLESAQKNFQTIKQDLWFLAQIEALNQNFLPPNLDENSPKSLNPNLLQDLNSLLETTETFFQVSEIFLEIFQDFSDSTFYIFNQGDHLKNLREAVTKTTEAQELLASIKTQIYRLNPDNFPEKFSSQIKLLQDNFQKFAEEFDLLTANLPAILDLLGDQTPHRYLILFQNNNEIRGTGGFIGSYAVVDVNEGKISKISVEDVYDLSGSYTSKMETPPEFQEFTPNLYFRDANYQPDFQIAGPKLIGIFQAEGGPTIDTVIAINQNLLGDLLEILGPLEIQDYGEFNSKNYDLLLSYIIESKFEKDDPKFILKQFIAEFQKKFLNDQGEINPELDERTKIALFHSLVEATIKEEILFYSAKPAVEELFSSYGLAENFRKIKENEDYLSVVHTSVGGNKSDKYIEEKITHQTEINENGEVVNTLTIERQHLWNSEIEENLIFELQQQGFEIVPESLLKILGNDINKTKTKIYLPKDVEIIKITNQNNPQNPSPNSHELNWDPEMEKNYLLLDLQVRPREESKVQISYKLPWEYKLRDPETYKLYVDKQPGSKGSIFTKTIEIPKKIKGNKVEDFLIYPPENDHSNQEIMFTTNLVYDRNFQILLSPEHLF